MQCLCMGSLFPAHFLQGYLSSPPQSPTCSRRVPPPPCSCRESRTYYRAHLRNHLRSHADESDALRIAQLQERGRADAAWVVKKVGGGGWTLRE